jgi:hypothetical protein
MQHARNDTMNWKQEIDRVEAEALEIEALELKAESEFDRVNEIAQAQGDPSLALKTPEFDAWMAARNESDTAWGRWFQVMGNRPTGE